MQQSRFTRSRGGSGLASQSEQQDENELGVSAGSIYGLKKTVFNSADFADVVVSTYAAAH